MFMNWFKLFAFERRLSILHLVEDFFELHPPLVLVPSIVEV